MRKLFLTLTVTSFVSPVQADLLVTQDALKDVHLEALPRTEAEAARIAAVTARPDDVSAPERFETNSGGAGSVARLTDIRAYSLPQANLTFEEQSDFFVGNGLFERLWVAAPASTIASDGLGPMYNLRSCQDCHIKDGRGHAPLDAGDTAGSLAVRLGRPLPVGDELARYLGAAPDPVYGHQLSDFSIAGVPAEGRPSVTWEVVESVPLAETGPIDLRRPVWEIEGLGYGPLDPETAISPRVAPQMIGLGLVEAIPAADIMAHADPEDADGDGISGRPNIVWSPEYEQAMLGRFGVRATTPTLRQQAADAFNADMGLASPLRPDAWGDCTEAQTACRASVHGMDAAQGGFEVSGDALDLTTFYSATLAVPKRGDVGDPEVLRGKELFHQSQCAACHVPKFVTARLRDRPAHSFQLIWPYSDFLLHDMGPGLADSLPAGQATGSEWRTPPLWGLGLVQQVSPEAGFLHDGRARTIEEAILWHGGEGAGARNAYAALPPLDRAALLTFLESL
ncbi:thiol oxidoreductase [Jannaschia pagri]|uniref:Thiol oxidoreductase n=1 Tax=Jannaschia pagri TaxID=2829797 RepID=A0ABQ4NRJ8_9RHOB|nr:MULTISPECIES: di-heme oxidoredictase family protein [unclassified Jannaschia]GIT93193.1 thiol oxidoreductase [Jannaschia sp. AI_61]GIT97040.1 thiol oxidoreductase [Jannaschia sp. AI_62]